MTLQCVYLNYGKRKRKPSVTFPRLEKIMPFKIESTSLTPERLSRKQKKALYVFTCKCHRWTQTTECWTWSHSLFYSTIVSPSVQWGSMLTRETEEEYLPRWYSSSYRKRSTFQEEDRTSCIYIFHPCTATVVIIWFVDIPPISFFSPSLLTSILFFWFL